MDLDFTQEQQMLRETVRGLCSEASPVAVVRAMEDDPIGFPAPLWKQMSELGLVGLMLPEAYGGGGQSMVEGAILYEELGRALAPSPHFVSAVMSGGVLATAGSEAQKQAWLPRIASGEAIVTPAWLEPKGGFGPKGVQLRARLEGGEYRLSGVKQFVAFAGAATRLLVLARTGEGAHDIELLLVDPKAPGIALQQEYTLAADAEYRVTFSDVRVPAGDRIGASGSGWATWNAVLLDGIVLLAAQAAGGAQRIFEIACQYAKEREQFDKPLAAFQSIAHYLADRSTEIDGGTTLVYEAAWARANGRSIERLAPMAKLFACDTFRKTTATAQQVHGGMGFTIECDAQLFFRRAKYLQSSWWDARVLEERIASTLLDAGRPQRLIEDGRKTFETPPRPHPRGVRSLAQMLRDLAEHANQRGRCQVYVDTLTAEQR